MDERYPDWKEFYIRYKALKNALYAERESESSQKGQFMSELAEEIKKVRIESQLLDDISFFFLIRFVFVRLRPRVVVRERLRFSWTREDGIIFRI